MSGFGGLLILFGVGSFILNMIGMEFRLLMWIDLWGPLVGNGIRIGMVLLGALLLYIGKSQGSTDD